MGGALRCCCRSAWWEVRLVTVTVAVTVVTVVAVTGQDGAVGGVDVDLGFLPLSAWTVTS
jgi:hypothetical protein